MIIVVGSVVVFTLAYFFLMFFFPEWVGISGEDTQKAIESHREDTQKTIESHQEDSGDQAAEATVSKNKAENS